MRRSTLALTSTDFDRLAAASRQETETAFVAQVGDAADGAHATHLLHGVEAVSETAYVERTARKMTIRSDGFVPAIGSAAQSSQGFAFLHTHPGSSARHSELDDRVDSELSDLTFRRTQSDRYVSVVVGGAADAPTLSARVFDRGGDVRTVDAVRVVGPEFKLTLANQTAETNLDAFERQIRVFGAEGQAHLRQLHAGVVGLGGTGSAVVEQLARLGIGELTVIDDDIVTDTNVTRVFGSSVRDVGLHKVRVAERNVEAIGLGTQVRSFVGRVTDQPFARELRHCDVVFGCSDDQRGRAVLNRLSYWYLVPFLDMGVVVRPDTGGHPEVTGRVTVVGPGSACLLCRGRLDPVALAAEALPPAERERLHQEGYVEGLAEPDPSVVTYTTTVAALATSEMLARFFSLGRGELPSELIARITDREVRGNTAQPVEGHFCGQPQMWGHGDQSPMLGLLWT